MNTYQMANIAISLRLAGGDYPVRALTYRELAELSAWIDRNATSPIGRAIREISQIRSNGGIVDQETEDSILNRAEEKMLAWPPRPATDAWFQELNKAHGGMVELVRSILLRTVPGFDTPRAESLFEAMSVDEFKSLYYMGVFGARPKSEGGVPDQDSRAENEPDAIQASPNTMIGGHLRTGWRSNTG